MLNTFRQASTNKTRINRRILKIKNSLKLDKNQKWLLNIIYNGFMAKYDEQVYRIRLQK